MDPRKPAQPLLGTFGLSLSKASAYRRNLDIEQPFEHLPKGWGFSTRGERMPTHYG